MTENPLEHNMGTDSVERSIGRLEGKLDSAILAMGGIRGEVKSLRNDFMHMEKGRLSKLEVGFATLETTVQIKARSSAIIWAIGASIFTSVVSGITIALIIRTL